MLACVRKIFWPQITGVELPWLASATFHFTFSFALHFSGRFFSVLMPCPVGPRQAGQSAASVTEAVVIRRSAAASLCMAFLYC